MPKYQMPDGQDYDFPNDDVATRAMTAWKEQFPSEQHAEPSGSPLQNKSLSEMTSELSPIGMVGQAAASGLAAAPEFLASMLSGTPAMVTGAAGKAYGLLTGEDEAGRAALAEKATPELFKSMSYEPRTIGGQALVRGAGELVSKAGEATAIPGALVEAARATAMGEQPATSFGDKFLSSYDKLKPITRDIFEVALVGKGALDIRAGYKANQKIKSDKIKQEQDAKLTAGEAALRSDIEAKRTTDAEQGGYYKGMQEGGVGNLTKEEQTAYNKAEAKLDKQKPIGAQYNLAAEGVSDLGTLVPDSPFVNPTLNENIAATLNDAISRHTDPYKLQNETKRTISDNKNKLTPEQEVYLNGKVAEKIPVDPYMLQKFGEVKAQPGETLAQLTVRVEETIRNDPYRLKNEGKADPITGETLLNLGTETKSRPDPYNLKNGEPTKVNPGGNLTPTIPKDPLGLHPESPITKILPGELKLTSLKDPMGLHPETPATIATKSVLEIAKELEAHRLQNETLKVKTPDQVKVTNIPESLPIKDALGNVVDSLADYLGVKKPFLPGEGLHKALTDLSRSLWDAGHQTFLKASAEARKMLGDAWKDVAPLFKQAWDYAKSIQPGLSIKGKVQDIFTSPKDVKRIYTIDEVKAEYAKKFNDTIPDEFVDRYKDILEGRGKEIAKQEAMSKIPGMEDVSGKEVKSLKSLEDMKPQWEVEKDIGDGTIQSAVRENFSPMRMTVARTGNSLLDWGTEHIYGNLRETQVVIKKIHSDLRGELNTLTKGVIGKFTKSDVPFIEMIGEMGRVEGTKNTPNIPPQAKALYEKLREYQQKTFDVVNKVLTDAGYTEFRWRPNYLAGVFNGPYRALATLTKDGKDTVVGVIAGKTMSEARYAVDQMRAKFPDANIPDPIYQSSFAKQTLDASKRYAANSELLNLIKGDDVLANKFQDILETVYAKSTKDYLAYSKHGLEKKGVFGSEGNVPWRSIRDNAYDMFEAQLATMEQGLMFAEQMNTGKVIHELLADPKINMPAAKQLLSTYFQHAYGKLENQIKISDSAVDFASQSLGISVQSAKEASSILRNFALANTLGASSSFLISQVVQVPTALLTSFAKAREMGAKANPIMASAIGSMDLVNYIFNRTGSMSTEGKFFADYAKKYGIFDPHLVEHEVHRKVIPTTGMGLGKRIVAESVNVALKGLDIESKFLGKLFIEKPESFTRGTYYMSMAHYYKQAGYSLKEAAHLADKDTSIHFVDYHMAERAMGFQKMGELGKFASTVSTFKINALNQYPTFASKGLYGTLAALGLATWATSGLMGMPFVDDMESISTTLKSQGLTSMTLKEYMLTKNNDTTNFGLLAQAPTMIGQSPIAIQTKFSQANVAPDSLMEFLYPLASFYGRGAMAVGEAASTPTTKSKGLAVRAIAPGNLKIVVDKAMLTDSEGMTALKSEGPGVKRTKEDWKSMGIYGVPSLKEFKERSIARQIPMHEKVQKEREQKAITKMDKYLHDGNIGDAQKEMGKLMELNPDNAIDTIFNSIERSAQANSMTVDQYTDFMLSKKAMASSKGVKNLQFKRGME